MVLVNTVDAELGLIEQAQQGDRSAFGELARRHYQNVIHVVYRMCGDLQLAEDAAQETFLRAWVNLPSFQEVAIMASAFFWRDSAIFSSPTAW